MTCASSMIQSSRVIRNGEDINQFWETIQMSLGKDLETALCTLLILAVGVAHQHGTFRL